MARLTDLHTPAIDSVQLEHGQALQGVLPFGLTATWNRAEQVPMLQRSDLLPPGIVVVGADESVAVAGHNGVGVGYGSVLLAVHNGVANKQGLDGLSGRCEGSCD